MKLGVVLAALAGLAGTAYLIFVVGFDAVWEAVTSVGWSGFAALWVYGAANFLLLGLAWALLVPPSVMRRVLAFCWGRAVRDSAGDVLPFSQIGGMVIGARAVILRGLGVAWSFGSMIVDVTLEMVSQIVFVIVGLVILALTVTLSAEHMEMLEAAIAGTVVAVLAAAAFVVAQRRGFSALERIAGKMLPKTVGHASAIEAVVKQIHASPWRMLGTFSLHFAGWMSSAFGTWLALTLIGQPLSFTDAIAIESLLCAARSAAVFVPGAIGVQEAGYAVMMPLFGLPPEIGLAVSLLKRAREIAVGVPVLLSWQLAETGHAAKTKKRTLKGVRP